MRVRTAVRRICEYCYIVRRKKRIYVYCTANVRVRQARAAFSGCRAQLMARKMSRGCVITLVKGLSSPPSPAAQAADAVHHVQRQLPQLWEPIPGRKHADRIRLLGGCTSGHVDPSAGRHRPGVGVGSGQVRALPQKRDGHRRGMPALTAYVPCR